MYLCAFKIKRNHHLIIRKMKKSLLILTMAFCFVGLNFMPLFAQNTGCDNLSVPYAQDFEGVSNYALPDCWGQIHPFEEGGYPVAAPASP